MKYLLKSLKMGNSSCNKLNDVIYLSTSIPSGNVYSPKIGKTIVKRWNFDNILLLSQRLHGFTIQSQRVINVDQQRKIETNQR